MKLRAQLILAFVLLAVVPLTGLTVYYYLSSIEAFRHVVEAESTALAEDMGARMQLVTGDLNRRIERLRELPFWTLLDAKENQDTGAEELYVNLMKEMGEAAAYVDSFEFKPTMLPAVTHKDGIEATPEKAAPFSPSPPPPVGPSSVLIYMHEAAGKVGNQDGVVTTEINIQIPDLEREEVTVEKQNGDRLVVRRRPRKNRIASTPALTSSEDALKSAEKELEDLKRVAKAVEKKTVQVAEAAAQGDEAAAERLEQLTRKAARIAARQEKMHVLLNQEFDCEVQEAGKRVGTISAQVNAGQVMHSVLQRTQRAQGEIPFAVDSEGNLYTPNPENMTDLENLKVSAAGFVPSSGERQGSPKDWVVVTRHEPRYGLTFGIARPIGESIQEIRDTAVRNLGYGVAIIGLALLGILPLSGRMTRNLRSLTKGAEHMARGDFDVQVPVRSSDEFGQLAITFNRMAKDLKEHQKNLLEQERIRNELEMCRQIQEEMLPRTPLCLPFGEVRGVSIPAREVGGDFFNYFALPDGKVAILIGDVSGKGFPAALLMANLQATLRARLPLENDLEKLATELDYEIHAQTTPESYLTLFIAVLDPSTNVLTWVNAGHNTQFALQRAGQLEKLASTGRPLGLLPGGGYEARQLKVASGDSLFLYTDGLVDCMNLNGEVFGNERLESVVVEGWNSNPDALMALVEKASHAHRQGREAADDATMMSLRIAT